MKTATTYVILEGHSSIVLKSCEVLEQAKEALASLREQGIRCHMRVRTSTGLYL